MLISRHSFRVGCVVAALALATLSLDSCELAKNQLTYDRGTNQDIQDYRDALSPDHRPGNGANTAALPEFQSVVATPADLKLPSPLVTVSVNQTVSLHDLMFELAEQAGVDLEMDPNIHGSIIFTAKDRPFNEVIDRICEMSGLRYTFKSNVLRIELDRPYLKDYKVDYMSTARKNSSKIETGISTSAGNSGGGSGGSTASSTNGSSAKVENSNDNDFWKDIDAGLKQLLSSSDNYTSLASQEEPVAVPIAPPPPPLPAGANGAPATPPLPSTLPPTLNVSAAPAGKAPPNAPASYSISKETGVVSVFATERQQKLVQKFLDKYRHQALTQILIEAKVLEVDLNDQYATGIDWGVMGANLTRLIPSLTANFPSPGVTAAPASTAFTTNLDLGHGFHPVIQALSAFGTVRSLSSPRVTVMNNQSAIVNVAQDLVYFTVQATVTPATQTSAATTTFNTTQQSVPQGVLLNVTPTANPDTGDVILAVRPTVSKEVATVTDPSIALNVVGEGGAQGLNNYTQLQALNPTLGQVPEMFVQEMDSVLKMQSGQTMVMGGLMKDGNTINQAGIPIIGDIPGIGALFHSHGDNVQKSELVIFLKASIMPGSNVQDMDRKVYKQFGDDTRPFSM